MEIVWDQSVKARWDKRVGAAGGALQQDWAYGAAVARFGGAAARAEVRRDGRLIACAQVIARRFGGFAAVGLLSRGPVWLAELDLPTRAAALRLIKRTAPLRGLRALFVTPDEPCAGAASAARLWRVMTGHTEAVVDLTADADAQRARFKGKWRNRLRAAEAAPIRVALCQDMLAPDHWLLRAEAEQRRAKGYAGPPPALAAAFQREAGRRGAALVAEARAPGERAPLAGMLFLRHGAGATYLIGWSGAAGRQMGAHNLLLWRAMRRLVADGASHIDLGGLDTRRAGGLARFKLGAGARAHPLCGTFV